MVNVEYLGPIVWVQGDYNSLTIRASEAIDAGLRKARPHSRPRLPARRACQATDPFPDLRPVRWNVAAQRPKTGVSTRICDLHGRIWEPFWV